MSGQEKEWLTPTELAEIVRKHSIAGFPTIGTSMYKFMQRNGVLARPDLAKLKRIGSKRYVYSRSVLDLYRQDRNADWLSASDLMAASLPGLPYRSLSKMNSRLKADFRADASKWRVIRGSGGGRYEYHISLFTPEQQQAWRRYCGGGDQTQDAEKVPDRDPAPEKPSSQPAPTDLSTVKNSALLAELMSRIFRALGDEDGRPS